MKTKLYITLFVILAVSGLQAEDLTYRLRKDLRSPQANSAESQRLPAMTRIRSGLTPYVYEGRSAASYRHDEVSTSVMAVHITRTHREGPLILRAGHSLAPRVDQITKR